MDELARHRIIMFGFILLFVNQFVVVYTFLMAYFNDGKTLVHVNLFGEQYVDAFVLGLILIVSCTALVFLFQQHEQFFEERDIVKKQVE